MDLELVNIFSNGTTDETKAAQMYMASECHNGKWSTASDIFAFGILIYYTLTAEHRDPFYTGKGQIDIKTAKENIKGKVEADVDFEKLASRTDEEKHTQKIMIKQMVAHNPKDPLNIDEVLHYPTFFIAKKKLEFLLKVPKSVKNFWPQHNHPLKKKIQEALKNFETALYPEIMFKDYSYLTDKSQKIENGWQSLNDNLENFNAYLTGLRNKVAHACDENGFVTKFI